MWEFKTHVELKSYLHVLPGQGWQFNLLIDNKIWGYFWSKKSELIKSLIFITQLSKYIYIHTLSILVKLVNSCLKVSIFKWDISKEHHKRKIVNYFNIRSSPLVACQQNSPWTINIKLRNRGQLTKNPPLPNA